MQRPLGAVIGSFLNVVAHRVPRGESLVSPGSHCPECGAPVKPYDNVPVVSWLAAARPLPQLRRADLAALPARRAAHGRRVRRRGGACAGFDDDLVLELPFVAALIALAAIDFDHKLLPNKIVYPLAAYGVIATLLVDQDDLVENLIAGAGAFLFLLAGGARLSRAGWGWAT